MREALTIQCGNAANYVGTHFWNFQDPTSETQKDVDHDVLFSAGQARNATPTYTPRLLIYDHARHFGSMRRMNALFQEPESDTGNLEVVQPERIPEHSFQQSLEENGTGDAETLESESVRFWSDYNTQFYRPETYLPITTFADTTDFEDYDYGRTTYRTRSQQNDVLDSDVRPFLEECDAVSLLQITSAVTDAWAGYTTDLLLDLSSELPKVQKALYSTTRASSRVQHMAVASTLLALHDEVDLIVPFDADASWRGSAAAADWIDTFTIPFRTADHALRLEDITSFMTPGHKLFAPRLSGSPVGCIRDAAIERQFKVARGHKEIDLQSRLVNGKLTTTYSHTSVREYPASFPVSERLDNVVASLEDSALGSAKYLAEMRQMIAGIKGAKGYADRKDQMEEVQELEGRYRSELLDSEESSDEDGF